MRSYAFSIDVRLRNALTSRRGVGPELRSLELPADLTPPEHRGARAPGTVKLPDYVADYYRCLGDGNISAGIHRHYCWPPHNPTPPSVNAGAFTRRPEPVWYDPKRTRQGLYFIPFELRAWMRAHSGTVEDFLHWCWRHPTERPLCVDPGDIYRATLALVRLEPACRRWWKARANRLSGGNIGRAIYLYCTTAHD